MAPRWVPRQSLLTWDKGNITYSSVKTDSTPAPFPWRLVPMTFSGGSVSYELGTSSFDSIELRDGTVLTGDLIAISGMDVMVRVGGNVQHIDRNKIKRI